MDEMDFKLELMKEIGEIKANVKTLMIENRNRMPCQQGKHENDIRVNRRLILMLVAGLASVAFKSFV